MKIYALLFAFCSSALFAQQLPPAPKAHLTDVTPKPGFFNEPAIAVNPKDPQQLVAAWQVNASLAYSRDGGQTWKVAEGTAPKEYRISGDVSITYDSAGRAILCYIAFDKLGTTTYWAHGATRNGIFIRRSPDGGQTWEPEAVTIIALAWPLMRCATRLWKWSTMKLAFVAIVCSCRSTKDFSRNAALLRS